MIYLDNAATTYPKSEAVYEAMDRCNRTLAVNAGRGSYRAAREGADLISGLRKKLLSLANGEKVAEVCFTASATCAFNQIIGGLDIQQDQTVYVSPFEHNAVMRTLSLWQDKSGFRVEEIPVNTEVEGRSTVCFPDLQKVRYAFTQKKPDYVFLSHVSNVTGCMLPVREIAEMAKEYGAVVVIDGAQALGVVPVDLIQLKADFYVFAGHKTLY